MRGGERKGEKKGKKGYCLGGNNEWVCRIRAKIDHQKAKNNMNKINKAGGKGGKKARVQLLGALGRGFGQKVGRGGFS